MLFPMSGATLVIAEGKEERKMGEASRGGLVISVEKLFK